MDKLPLETARHIVSYLTKRTDVASLRLVSRTFAILGAELLFHTISFHPSYPSLSRLCEISQRPHLAHNIRELVLDLPPIRDLIWGPFVRHLETEGIDISSSTERIPEAFRLLTYHVDQYSKLQTSGDFTSMLREAVRGLPRLRGVLMKENNERDRDYWLSQSSLTLGCNGGFNYRIELSAELHGYSGSKDHYRAFAALVDAVYYAGCKLDTFYVDAKIDPRMFFDNTVRLERAGAVFQNCRVLGLKMDIEDSMVEHLIKTPLFNVILPSSPNLQSLTLQFGISCAREAIPLSTIFGSKHVWPRLQKVNFSFIDMEDQELYAFLLRHKGTLRELSFSMCSLYAGRWDDAMMFLRQNLGLVALRLDPLFELAGEFDYLCESELKMMEDYVVNGGKCLPPRED